MKVLIIITIGDVHYPEGLCTASPRELSCQLLLIFLCSLQPLWFRKPPWGEKHATNVAQNWTNHAGWSLGTQSPGWMLGGQHEYLPPALENNWVRLCVAQTRSGLVFSSEGEGRCCVLWLLWGSSPWAAFQDWVSHFVMLLLGVSRQLEKRLRTVGCLC